MILLPSGEKVDGEAGRMRGLFQPLPVRTVEIERVSESPLIRSFGPPSPPRGEG